MTLDVFFAIVAMALASYACRAGGYFLMRFVTVKPPVAAALQAIPISVMAGIAAPAVADGGLAEWLGIGGAFVLMKLTRNDMVAMLGGVAIVAIVRQAIRG
ncbi:MAG TPA: AzlD domain-containing protein [Casimicrobiaceae bacterium]|nr:AzlD domain-containing protein [Casimicrobiaceae bacterium]